MGGKINGKMFFADTGYGYQVVKNKNCKEFNLYKTVEEVHISREKALKRIKSSDEKYKRTYRRKILYERGEIDVNNI